MLGDHSCIRVFTERQTNWNMYQDIYCGKCFTPLWRLTSPIIFYLQLETQGNWWDDVFRVWGLRTRDADNISPGLIAKTSELESPVSKRRRIQMSLLKHREQTHPSTLCPILALKGLNDACPHWHLVCWIKCYNHLKKRNLLQTQSEIMLY
jgi:hypothetical protein